MHPNNIFRFGRLAMIAAVVSVSISSCNSDEEEPSAPGSTPTPTINDGHGTLVAVKTITTINQPFIGDIDVEFGIGVAVFTDGTNYESYVDGGTVTCEGETLSKFDHGSYSSYSQTSVTGLEFSGNPDWTVSGAGNIPQFSHTANRGFPNVGKITSATTINRANGYTLTFQGNMSNTDSVIWVIGSKVFPTTVAMNTRTFTADELNDVQTGAGNIIQVAAYNLDSREFGGKTFYFVNEFVVTQTVTVE